MHKVVGSVSNIRISYKAKIVIVHTHTWPSCFIQCQSGLPTPPLLCAHTAQKAMVPERDYYWFTSHYTERTPLYLHWVCGLCGVVLFRYFTPNNADLLIMTWWSVRLYYHVHCTLTCSCLCMSNHSVPKHTSSKCARVEERSYYSSSLTLWVRSVWA